MNNDSSPKARWLRGEIGDKEYEETRGCFGQSPAELRRIQA